MAERTVLLPRRCVVTGHPCGIDTWQVDNPCDCHPCRLWMYESLVAARESAEKLAQKCGELLSQREQARAALREAMIPWQDHDQSCEGWGACNCGGRAMDRWTRALGES